MSTIGGVSSSSIVPCSHVALELPTGMKYVSVSEDVVLGAGAYTDSSAFLLPAYSQVVAVRTEVLVALAGAATFDLGVSIDPVMFQDDVSGALAASTNTFKTNPPLSPYMNYYDRKVRITPSVAGASGTVKVNVIYMQVADL
jgi:hypothetical protein